MGQARCNACQRSFAEEDLLRDENILGAVCIECFAEYARNAEDASGVIDGFKYAVGMFTGIPLVMFRTLCRIVRGKYGADPEDLGRPGA